MLLRHRRERNGISQSSLPNGNKTVGNVLFGSSEAFVLLGIYCFGFRFLFGYNNANFWRGIPSGFW